MRNRPSFNFPAFHEAERVLVAAGHTVFNPAAHDEESGFDAEGLDGTEDLAKFGFSLRDALGADLAWLTEHADGVAVLPGWIGSKGACAEVATADALGVPVRSVDYFTSELTEEVRIVPGKYVPAIGDRVRIVDADYLGNRPEYVGEITGLDGDSLNRFERPHPIKVTGDGLSWYAVEVELIETAAEIAEYEEGLAEAQRTYGVPQRFMVGADPDEMTADDARDLIVPRGGEVRVTSSTGGAKGSKGARFDLIPTGPLWELAEHYGKGAQKYERVNGIDNWRNGYDWSLSYAALQRHVNAFWNGEDIDPENGSKHIIAAAWHCLALAHFAEDEKLRELFDDRQEGV